MTTDERDRLALIRAAKARKARRTGSDELTPVELDRLLPPVPCARTRNARTWGGRGPGRAT